MKKINFFKMMFLTVMMMLGSVSAWGASTEYILNNNGVLNADWSASSRTAKVSRDGRICLQVMGPNSGNEGEVWTNSVFSNVTEVSFEATATAGSKTVTLFYSEDSVTWNQVSQLTAAPGATWTTFSFQDLSAISGKSVYLKIRSSVNSLYVYKVAITTQEEAIPHTVTLEAGAGSVSQASYPDVTSLVLPTPTLSESCANEGWIFAGWKADSAQAETNSIPSLIPAESAYTPGTDVTLYAVYKKVEGETLGTITTKASDISNLGAYNAYSWTKDGISFVGDKLFAATSPNAGAIQMNTNQPSFVLYNATAIPGLKSVTINLTSGSANQVVVYQSATANGQTTQAGLLSASGKIDITSGNEFFTIKPVKGVIYISDIVLEYESGVIYNSNPSCCWIDAPVALEATSATDTSFTANWTGNSPFYRLNVYTIEESEEEQSGLATDLFFSEYVEGSSNNKYLEIYNGTGNSVDLSDYKLQFYANGNPVANNDVALSGTLENGEVIVYRNTSAVLTLPEGVTATVNSACSFNGNDASVLYKISTDSYVDVIGTIGDDTNYGENMTLRRKSSVTSGIVVNPAGSFPTMDTEWDSYALDDVSGLGSHTMDATDTTIVIREKVLVLVKDVVDNFYDATGLPMDSSEETYYYTVQAYGEGDCVAKLSAESNEIMVGETNNCEIAAPVAMSAEPVYPESFFANWEFVEGASGYNVYVYSSEEDAMAKNQPIRTEWVDGANEVSVQIEIDLLPIGTTYYYVVEAVGSGDCSEATSTSNIVSVAFEIAATGTPIEVISANRQLTLRGLEETSTVMLYDIFQNKTQTFTGVENNLPITLNQAAGIYVVKVANRIQAETAKIIVE